MTESGVQIAPQTHESFLAGLTLYAARLDKRYSMTDCISMQAMRSVGITEVLTHDEHITQEGFTILFRNQP
jgi:predicted nucleic acid-binding protein